MSIFCDLTSIYMGSVCALARMGCGCELGAQVNARVGAGVSVSVFFQRPTFISKFSSDSIQKFSSVQNAFISVQFRAETAPFRFSSLYLKTWKISSATLFLFLKADSPNSLSSTSVQFITIGCPEQLLSFQFREPLGPEQ